MATSTVLSSRRGLGGFAALAGAALMIVSVFLPWVGDVTGWDSVNQEITSIRSAGDFYVNPAFADSGFSPFFTGLSILIAGGLLALISLAMLASLKGGAFRLPSSGHLALTVLGVIIAVVGVTNLASLYATGPGAGMLDPAYGLFVLTAGALIGFFGILGGASKGDS
jgi:hypothetical protein